MKHLKRSLALLLALVLTLSLISGCSKKEPGETPAPGSQTAEPEDPQKELEKKLKGLEKVKVGMSDEDVRDVAQNYLQEWRDVRFTVDRLRAAYLNERLSEEGR